MNKTKLSLTITAMVLVAMISIVSIIVVFAARTQNFTSSITVSYTSREVQGTATARWLLYYGGGKYQDGFYDMYDEDGNTELRFQRDQLQNATLNPDDEIVLEDGDDYVVFEYNFTNDGPHPYELTLTYEDDEIADENVSLFTWVTPIREAVEVVYDDSFELFFEEIEWAQTVINEKYNNTVITTVVPDEMVSIYILLEVTNGSLDASFSGAINFDLDGTNAKDYDEDFYYYTDGATATITGVANGERTKIGSWGDAYVNVLQESSLSIPTTTKSGLPIKTIGSAAFIGQANLTSISSFGNIENLGCYVFNQSGLTEVTIPGSIKNIYGTFWLNDDITSVTLQNGIQNIGNIAFNNSGIESLEIPPSVQYVGFMALFLHASNVKIDSQIVCENLMTWQTELERDMRVGGKIMAIDEIPGLLDYRGYSGEYFTQSETQENGYWVYTKVK